MELEYHSKTILLKLMRTWILMWVLFLRVAASDVDKDKDKEECANQVTELAKCLPYVISGELANSTTPTRDCCTGVEQVVHKNLRCICLLVIDRNDPDINATLALSLPSICQVPVNVSHCASLLHLAPGSADAKLFDDFANNGTEGSMAARARPRLGSNSVPGSGGGFLRPEILVRLSLMVAAAAAMVDHL